LYPSRTIGVNIPRNEGEVKRARSQPKEPWRNIRSDREKLEKILPRDEAELKKWTDWEAADDLEKQRKADLANGVTAMPRQRRPWIKPSHRPLSAEEKNLIPPDFKRQTEIWQREYKEEKKLERERKSGERDEH